MFKRKVSLNVKLLFTMLALLTLSISTKAQINNCCGIDRQCSTNDEWVSGYYAFRNSQCAAPAGSQQQSHQARQDHSSPQINNCCFNGWQCDSDDDWTSGYWAFRNDQCGSQAQGVDGNRQRQGVNGLQGPQGSSDDPRPQRLYSNQKREDEPLVTRVVNGVLVDEHGNPLRYESITFDPYNEEKREDETESGLPVILHPL